MDIEQLTRAKQDARLSQLEIDTRLISKDVKTIRDNHLVHISQDIDRIEIKVDKMDQRIYLILFGIISIIGTTVVSIWLS